MTFRTGRLPMFLALAAFIISGTTEYFRTFAFLENISLSFFHSIRYILDGSDVSRFPVDKLVVVAFDDLFFQEYDRFPLLRSDLATVIERIEDLGAGIVGVNLFLGSNSSCGNDAAFIHRLKKFPNLVFSSELKFSSDDEGLRIQYPIKSIHTNWASGYDNVSSISSLAPSINRLRIYPALAQQKDGWPFSIQLASNFLGVKPRLGHSSLDIGDIHLKLNRYQELAIDFSQIRGENISISAHDILNYEILGSYEQQELSDRIKGKIVLIGYRSAIVTSKLKSPVGPVFSIELNADIISTILNGGPLKPLGLVGSLLLTAVLLAFLLSSAYTFSGPVSRMMIFLAILASFSLGSAVLYAYCGWIVSMSCSLVGCILFFFSTELMFFIREKLKSQFIRNTFGRYLADEIVQELIDQPGGLDFRPREIEVSVIMSDLRGFSNIAGTLVPSKVVEIVNNYVSVMTPIIQKHHGIIDEIIGDALLVIFGAPIARQNHTQLAVMCALEMQQAMSRVNRRNTRAGLPVVTQGIAINSGTVVAGNIGSEKRSKWGVVGNTVNLAARIEGYTGAGQIYISDSVKDKLGSKLTIGARQTVQFKGYQEKQEIYQLTGYEGYMDLMQDQPLEAEWRPLSPELRVSISFLINKTVDGVKHPGEVTAWKNNQVRVQMQEPLPDGDRIQISILETGGNILTDEIFGMIRNRTSPNIIEIEITYLPGEYRQLLFNDSTAD